MKPYLIPFILGLSAAAAAAQTPTMLPQPSRLFRQGATPTSDDKVWLRALIGLDTGNSPAFAAVTATTFTGTLAGNASSATSAATLTTPRAINGVSFNGSGDITVPAAAGTLTGGTLAAGVTGSSLTSVGTLANLTVTNPITGSIAGNAATAATLTTPRTINGTSFNGSASISVSSTASQISDSTSAGRALLTAASPQAQLTALTVVTSSASTSYTLSDADSGTIIYFTAASAVTVTVPGTLSSGFNCLMVQGGGGTGDLDRRGWRVHWEFWGPYEIRRSKRQRHPDPNFCRNLSSGRKPHPLNPYDLPFLLCCLAAFDSLCFRETSHGLRDAFHPMESPLPCSHHLA